MTKNRNFLQKLWLRFNNPVKYCQEYENIEGFYQSLASDFNQKMIFLKKNLQGKYLNQNLKDKKMDLKNAWLSANPQNEFKNIIVLARSTRYNNPHIDYGFLKKYENIVFLGVESEYNLMKNTIPHLN